MYTFGERYGKYAAMYVHLFWFRTRPSVHLSCSAILSVWTGIILSWNFHIELYEVCYYLSLKKENRQWLERSVWHKSWIFLSIPLGRQTDVAEICTYLCVHLFRFGIRPSTHLFCFVILSVERGLFRVLLSLHTKHTVLAYFRLYRYSSLKTTSLHFFCIQSWCSAYLLQAGWQCWSQRNTHHWINCIEAIRIKPVSSYLDRHPKVSCEEKYFLLLSSIGCSFDQLLTSITVSITMVVHE